MALEFEARSLRVSCAFLVPVVECVFVANFASSKLLGLRPALDNGAALRLGKAGDGVF